VIIDRAFYRETLRVSAAILLVLLSVAMFQHLTDLVTRAAHGDIPGATVLARLGWLAIRRLDLLLSLSFFFGALLTLSRWYRDSEMVVLAACGVGVHEILKPVMRMALAVAALVCVFSLYLSPLAGRETEAIKSTGSRQAQPEQIEPGVFTESESDQRIVFVEDTDPRSGRLFEIFLASYEADTLSVMVASHGDPRVDPASGERWLSLARGHAYEINPKSGEWHIGDFGRYDAKLTERIQTTTAMRPDILPTSELFQAAKPTHMAELHWRLAKPLMVLVLAAYALLLAHSDTRRGRFASLFVAILVYFIYSNLLGIGQTLLKKNQLSPLLGLWVIHLGFVLAVAYWLARRARNLPLMPVWRKERQR
jgi:lipopolysaccharide export system permease protein